jgi:hypothetical protein
MRKKIIAYEIFVGEIWRRPLWKTECRNEDNIKEVFKAVWRMSEAWINLV